MRLRKKIVLLLTLVFGVTVLGSYLIQRHAVYCSFEELEREEAVKNWQRCQAAIEREVKVLSMFCLDWSGWDDMYNYAEGKNPSFYESSLAQKDYFADQNLPVLYICRPDGTVHWGQILDTGTLQPASISWLPPDRLSADHPLLVVQASKDSQVSGLVMTELGPMIVASRPILTSEYKGPVAGVLIFGRLLSDDMLKGLRQQTQVNFTTWPVGTLRTDLSSQEQAAAAEAVQSNQVVIRSFGPERLAVFGVLKDIKGQPVLYLQAKLTRQITARGHKAMVLATGSFAVAGMATLLVLVGALSWLVVNPLSRLTAHATQVGATGGLRKPLRLRRRDELGVLANALDSMLGKLDDYRYNAMKMSRQAGIAEIATGVLHNIGNALTNANVLASVMSEKAGKSKVPGLTKAMTLIRDHQQDLPTFLSQDRQGQQIVPYLTQLATHLNQEMDDHQRDLAALEDNLQHIKQILGAQQSLARSSNVVEPVDVKDTVEKSLAVIGASMRRHNIDFELCAEALPTVSCDRIKLSQVLVNLLTNAKDAVRDFEGPQRRVRVRVGVEANAAVIEVSDSGVGIKPEDLARIFSDGFTTKTDGHGFGLHYSVLAATEMGGRLTAASDGPGRGATFRLALPLHRAPQEVPA